MPANSPVVVRSGMTTAGINGSDIANNTTVRHHDGAGNTECPVAPV